MQELTRGGRGSSHSPVWQRTPLYPGWQLQSYPLTWSTHVPPFRQGLLEHSLISAIKDSRLWDGLDQAFVWYVYIMQWFHCKFNVTASFYVKGKTCDWLTCFTVFSLVTGCTATVILIFLIIWNASSFVLTRRAWTWCLLIEFGFLHLLIIHQRWYKIWEELKMQVNLQHAGDSNYKFE